MYAFDASNISNLQLNPTPPPFELAFDAEPVELIFAFFKDKGPN